MIRVEFHPKAGDELIAAALFYETRAHGLGRDFLAQAERVASRLSQFPQLGHRYGTPFRRVMLRRFPYSFIYRVDAERVYVLAVMHHRRRPGYWSDRV